MSNPGFTDWQTDSFGTKIDKSAIKSKIITLAKRLYPAQFEADVETETEGNEESTDETNETLEEKFDAIFKQSEKLTIKQGKDKDKALELETSAFEQSGRRSEILENLYKAMCTIPPTSVEAERAFSAVGLFVTKLRSSLADNTIDALLTLKNYFRMKAIEK